MIKISFNIEMSFPWWKKKRKKSLRMAIAKKAKIHKLTSYIARHTWASIAYNENVELNVISKGMGHTNTNTTLVYIKEINDSRLAEANAGIIAKLT